MLKSYDSLAQDPFADLLANCAHHASSRMCTAATEPNSSDFATDSVGEEVIKADAAMEDIAFCQAKQVFQVEGSQDIHVMDVQRFLQVLSDLFKEYLSDLLMRDGCNNFSIVGMIRRVLHEAIHDVIPFWAKSVIIHARDGEIHEWSETDTVTFSLVVRVHQKVHRVTVQVNRAAKQVLGGQFMTNEGFELGQLSQCEVDLGGSPIVLNILEFVIQILREMFFCIFDEIEKGNLVGAVTKDHLRLINLSVLQLHSNWTTLPIIHNFLDFSIEFDVCTHI